MNNRVFGLVKRVRQPFCRSFKTSNSRLQEYKIVRVAEVEDFIHRCMTKVGTSSEHALQLAKVLTSGDVRGHFSHGLNRLEMYVHDIEVGTTISQGEPKVVKESPATALVDGNNLLGPVVGNVCMDIAIKKAKEVGIAWVACRGSNHYGIAGWYTLRALEHGLIGISVTNTSPLLVPTRGREVTLGTNPLSVSAPGRDGDSFVLDMATSAVALGKIEMNRRKNEPIPHGWGVDNKGLETLNPVDVLDRGGGQLPLGGTELTSGYKGYGLAMMVEVLSGVLAGSAIGPNIRRWKGDDRIANLGQCFAAINPAMFETGYEDRMQSLIDHCRGMKPAEGEDEVLVAGDPERIYMKTVEQEGGIRYHVNLLSSLDNLADKLSVQRMAIKDGGTN